jgi:hypothetical protein
MIGIELVIHAALAPAHLDEIPYIGALFLLASVLLAAVLVMLLLPYSRTPWLLGAAICAGMLIAFLISRTLGLPGYHESWFSDDALGLASIPPEVAFVACAWRVLRDQPAQSGLE